MRCRILALNHAIGLVGCAAGAIAIGFGLAFVVPSSSGAMPRGAAFISASALDGVRAATDPGTTCSTSDASSDPQYHPIDECFGLSPHACPGSNCVGETCSTGCTAVRVYHSGTGFTSFLKAVPSPTCGSIGSTQDRGVCQSNANCSCKITLPMSDCESGVPTYDPAIIRCS